MKLFRQNIGKKTVIVVKLNITIFGKSKKLSHTVIFIGKQNKIII